jgi:cytochrome P450
LEGRDRLPERAPYSAPKTALGRSGARTRPQSEGCDNVMMNNSPFAQALEGANRANPYPFYALLRETPVRREEDGTYVVSTYAEIRSLLHDARVSSDDRPKPKHAKTGNPLRDFIINPIKAWIIDTHRSLIFRDPPDHTRLRRLVMTQLTAERFFEMGERINTIVADLVGRMRGRSKIDLVGEFAYPLPVNVICELLGVPAGDHEQFRKWSTSLVGVLDPEWQACEEQRLKTLADFEALRSYLNVLIKAKRKRPADDILSGLAAHKDKKHGSMGRFDLLATAVLLLVAGHETTVNLIANGVLTLLRYPEWLERLRRDNTLAPRIVEELLRFEPPVHFRTRKTLAEIEIAGLVIPKGAPLFCYSLQAIAIHSAWRILARAGASDAWHWRCHLSARTFLLGGMGAMRDPEPISIPHLRAGLEASDTRAWSKGHGTCLKRTAFAIGIAAAPFHNLPARVAICPFCDRWRRFLHALHEGAYVYKG